MSETLEFVRGPLFVATFAFMILGLVRHIVLRTTGLLQVRRKTPKRDIPWKIFFRRSAGWIVPVGHMKVGAPVLKIASIVFHVGLLLVPLFLVDHVLLWQRGAGFSWMSMGRGFADVLTLITIVTGLVLLLFRGVDRTARQLSRFRDYLLLVVLLLPFLSGWFASHPESAFLPYSTMMLIHVLSAELIFVLLPTTKLAHVVLFPFDRLSSDIFWRLVPGAGARVAETLRGSTEGAEV